MQNFSISSKLMMNPLKSSIHLSHTRVSYPCAPTRWPKGWILPYIGVNRPGAYIACVLISLSGMRRNYTVSIDAIAMYILSVLWAHSCYTAVL